MACMLPLSRPIFPFSLPSFTLSGPFLLDIIFLTPIAVIVGIRCGCSYTFRKFYYPQYLSNYSKKHNPDIKSLTKQTQPSESNPAATMITTRATMNSFSAGYEIAPMIAIAPDYI